jgi:hypothetical protein
LIKGGLALFCVCLFLGVSGLVTYKLDSSFHLGEIGNSYSAVAVVDQVVYIGQRNLTFKHPVLLVDKDGRMDMGWGEDAISNKSQFGLHGLASQVTASGEAFLWVADISEHTVKVFSLTGKLIKTLGIPNVAGSGLSPLQFGSVADIAFSNGGMIYISDGDGGVNNRVVALDQSGAVRYTLGVAQSGTQPGRFNSPHSVAHHGSSDVLFVADRGNNRTQLFAGETGAILAEWNCVLPATPWGLRVYQKGDLLFQVDGSTQTLKVFSLSAFSQHKPSDCSAALVQSIDLDANLCHTPHELAVDASNGDVYVACVGVPHSNVVRFTQSNQEKY